MSRTFKDDYTDIKIARPFKRVGAFAYDMMIVIALWMVTGFIAVGLNSGEAVGGPLFQSLLFTLTYLFLTFFWIRSGQTLGMLAWRLRVQTTEGYRLNFMQCLIRYLIGTVSLVCVGAGFLWMFIHPQKRTWHDIASGCQVVELPKTAKILE